jgi:uncharacterized protein
MKEIRLAEVRTADPAGTAGGMVIEGTAIVFGEKTEINDPAGSYSEIIESGALDGADLTDCHLFYNHDLNRVPLARTPRTMKLDVTPAGLDIVATLPETEDAKAVYEAVKRGDLSGMSFAFKVPEGGDSYDSRTNTRTISHIEKVYEVSIVPYPAYPSTSVEARSAIQKAEERRRLICECNRILLHA